MSHRIFLRASGKYDASSNPSSIAAPVYRQAFYITGGQYSTRTKVNHGNWISIPVTSGISYTVDFEYTYQNTNGEVIKIVSNNITIPTTLNPGNVVSKQSQNGDIEFRSDANWIGYKATPNKRIIGIDVSYASGGKAVVRNAGVFYVDLQAEWYFSNRVYVPENTTVDIVYYMETQSGCYEGFDGGQMTTSGQLNPTGLRDLIENCSVTYDSTRNWTIFSNSGNSIDSTFFYNYCNIIGSRYVDEIKRDCFFCPDYWYDDRNINFSMNVLEYQQNGNFYQEDNIHIAIFYVTQGLLHIQVFDFDLTSIKHNTEYIFDMYDYDSTYVGNIPSWILENAEKVFRDWI